MWRLKIAEGGNNPYLYSTNNFVGRQTWEFDPDYGTPEERAEVEQARLGFWNNRHDVKPSSDVLWRMQALCMLACWVEDPNGVCFKKHLARIPDYIWVAGLL